MLRTTSSGSSTTAESPPSPPSPQQRQHHLAGVMGLLVDPLHHAGESEELGHRVAVDPDQRHLLGDPAAVPEQLVDRSERHLVGVAEDGRRRVVEGREQRDPVGAGRDPEGPGDHVVVAQLEPGSGERVAVAAGAFHVGGPARPLGVAGAQHRDPGVAQLDQVAHGEQRHPVVVDAHVGVVAQLSTGHHHLDPEELPSGAPPRPAPAARSAPPRRPCDAPAGRGRSGCAAPRRPPGRRARRGRPRAAPSRRRPASRSRTTRRSSAPPRPRGRSPCAPAGTPRGRRRRRARRRSRGPARACGGRRPARRGARARRWRSRRRRGPRRRSC